MNTQFLVPLRQSSETASTNQNQKKMTKPHCISASIQFTKIIEDLLDAFWKPQNFENFERAAAWKRKLKAVSANWRNQDKWSISKSLKDSKTSLHSVLPFQTLNIKWLQFRRLSFTSNWSILCRTLCTKAQSSST